MLKTQGNSTNRRIIAQPGDLVKAKIVATGISLGAFAQQLRISQSYLSQTISGDRRGWRMQLRIWEAYRRLSGKKIPLTEFWGELLSERIAG